MALKLKINLIALLEALSKATTRFPMALIMATSASVLAIYLTEIDHKEIKNLIPYMLTAYLGIALFIGMSLLGESYKKLKWWRLIEFYGILLLPLFYWYLDTQPEYMQISRLFLIGLVLHLFVSVAAFLSSSNNRSFWQFNQNILIRFLLTAFYCAILYGGLCLALLAVNLLFDIKFDDIYLRLFIVVSTLFNTWFFCSGIPKSFNEAVQFPKGLKVFTQFVLIPLVLLYVLILYAYAGKIIIQWEWPIGWVSTLILGFCICGILAFLLVFPILKEKKNLWLRRLARGIFIALLPLVIMMALSVLRRISDYGITEERYYLANLVIWLGFVSFVYGILRSDRIKWIPISLLLFALLNIGGPLSATEVSVRNQKARLISGLENLDLLKDGIWQVNTKGLIKTKEFDQVAGPLKYLNDRKRLYEINELMPFRLDSLIDYETDFSYNKTSLLLNKMNFREDIEESNESNRYINFERSTKYYELNSDAYDLQFYMNHYNYGSGSEIYSEMIDKKQFTISNNDSLLIISIDKAKLEFPLLRKLEESIDIGELRDYSYQTQKYDTKKASFKMNCGEHQLMMIVDEFTLEGNTKGRLNHIKYSLWVKFGK